MIDVVYLFLNWLHLLALIIWIGGMFFVEGVLRPSIKVLTQPETGKLMAKVGERFKFLALGSLAVIILTGILRAIYIKFFDLDFLSKSSSGQTFFLKLVIVLIMLVLSILIARYNIKLPNYSSSMEIKRVSNLMSNLAKVELLLGSIVILLAVYI